MQTNIHICFQVYNTGMRVYKAHMHIKHDFQIHTLDTFKERKKKVCIRV